VRNREDTKSHCVRREIALLMPPEKGKKIKKGGSRDEGEKSPAKKKDHLGWLQKSAYPWEREENGHRVAAEVNGWAKKGGRGVLSCLLKKRTWLSIPCKKRKGEGVPFTDAAGGSKPERRKKKGQRASRTALGEKASRERSV